MKSLSAETPKLALEDIRKTFKTKGGPVPVLNGLSLKVMDQDFFGIIGPSGCGKTTIFNIIAGLFEPDSGEIYFDGKPTADLRGRVGYMMQKDLLFPWRTVLQNVLLGLQVKGKPRPSLRSWHGNIWINSGWPVSKTCIRGSFRAACANA